MIKDWKRTLVSPETSILEAIKVIDAGALQIALVVDDVGRLLGTVTDGDVRRAILRGVSLENPVSEIMFQKPKVAYTNESREMIIQKMTQHSIHHIPVLNEEGKIITVEFIEELIKGKRQENEVMLIAGGLGTRLRPLTENYPKPMLSVGGKPILETIISNFLEYGFYKFRISVNYMADVIENYFGDGSQWGAEIQYIYETKRMGTAGALSLIDEKPSLPFFVMNADLLTKVNFQQLLEYHTEHEALATLCVRQYDYQVPYGVVEVNNQRLLEIKEKPTHQYFINAGIYLLEPDALAFVPKDDFFDMPMLLQKLVENGRQVSVFPVREYWMDIGRLDDFNQANNDFSGIFG